MRRWWLPLLLLATLASVALAACDQSNPPALGKPVAVTLRATGDSAALGQATLTPAYGAHVVVYMHGALRALREPADARAASPGRMLRAGGGAPDGECAHRRLSRWWRNPLQTRALMSRTPWIATGSLSCCSPPRRTLQSFPVDIRSLTNVNTSICMSQPRSIKGSASASRSSRVLLLRGCMSHWPRPRHSSPPNGVSIAADARVAHSPAARLRRARPPAAAQRSRRLIRSHGGSRLR